MTLRYSLFGKPGNISEVTNLLKSKHASSVRMEFGEGYIDIECPKEVPSCDYIAITPLGELKFQHLFVARSSLSQWIGAVVPFGDAALLNYESRKNALEQLQEQRRYLEKSGIEAELVEVS